MLVKHKKILGLEIFLKLVSRTDPRLKCQLVTENDKTLHNRLTYFWWDTLRSRASAEKFPGRGQQNRPKIALLSLF